MTLTVYTDVFYGNFLATGRDFAHLKKKKENEIKRTDRKFH
jgi:hypothetical protein